MFLVWSFPCSLVFFSSCFLVVFFFFFFLLFFVVVFLPLSSAATGRWRGGVAAETEASATVGADGDAGYWGGQGHGCNGSGTWGADEVQGAAPPARRFFSLFLHFVVCFCIGWVGFGLVWFGLVVFSCVVLLSCLALSCLGRLFVCSFFSLLFVCLSACCLFVWLFVCSLGCLLVC